MREHDSDGVEKGICSPIVIAWDEHLLEDSMVADEMDEPLQIV